MAFTIDDFIEMFESTQESINKDTYSFMEAMSLCHAGYEIEPTGSTKLFSLKAEVIGHRYAIRYDNGNEYYTRPEHLSLRWKIKEKM